MKKLKVLGATSFALIGCGALASIPITLTSCSNRGSLKIAASDTSCNFAEEISVTATVKNIDIDNNQLRWYVDGTLVDKLNQQLAVYSQSGEGDNNIKISIINHNNIPNKIYTINNIYAQTADGKYTSNKINLSLNPITENFKGTIMCVPNKRSIRYYEAATITAWIFSEVGFAKDTITFTTETRYNNVSDSNWHYDDNLDEDIPNAQRQITNWNITQQYFSLETKAVSTDMSFQDCNICSIEILPVKITCSGGAKQLELHQKATWTFDVSDSNFVLKTFDYKFIGEGEGTFFHVTYGDKEKNKIITIENTNYMQLNAFDLVIVVTAIANDKSELTSIYAVTLESN